MRHPYAGPEILSISEPFVPSDYDWSTKSGANTLVGNAVLRTQGGEARTCAGLQALIVPVGKYSTARVVMLYGQDDHGYMSAYQALSRQLERNPDYEKLSRKTTCDSQGNFTFENLPDGAYYVNARVVWNVPSSYGGLQGGILMQKVELKGGKTTHIVLSAL